eukprot:TRINITY_DN1805_c0_g1_i1.p1 TRINITY_DN1805_c0_g1~~TRINITY_DN1805_c0_g1_i1.p1  ORF type:complete len:528 (-),score=175.98 TRINITY_DN1805_c0_g1_i1:101-1684(-)
MASEGLTLFLKLGEEVKKVVAQIETFQQLHQSLRERFSDNKELRDADDEHVQFYLTDKQFHIPYKLEDVTSLYEGAVVEARIHITEQKHSASTKKRKAEDIAASEIQSDYIVRLKGLPWRVTESEIEEFLSGVNILPKGIFIATDPRGSRIGEAYVQVASEEDLELARSKDRANMGRRYVEVYRSTSAELRHALLLAQHDAPSNIGSGLAIIRLRGLPFSANEPEIQEFLGDIRAQAIHFVMTPSGKKSGDAFVELASEAEAIEALKLHRQHLGSRYVEVTRSTHEEAKRAMGVVSYDDGNNIIKMVGIPFAASDHDIMAFFQVAGVTPVRIYRKPSGGDAFVEFAGSVEVPRAMARNKSHIGARYIELHRVTRAEFMQGLLGMFGMSSGGGYSPAPPAPAPPSYGHLGMDSLGMGGYGASHLGMGMGMNMPSMAPVPSPALDMNNAQPGSTVKLQGLPWKATARDIEEFFRGFDVIPSSIRIGQDASGRASGEAWVSFVSPDSARLAYQTKNLQYLGDRYVKVFVQ